LTFCLSHFDGLSWLNTTRAWAENSRIAAAKINKLSISSVEIAETAAELLKKTAPDIQKTADLG
jgi:hypothetical protein